MKRIAFVVELIFEDKIYSDDEIKEVGRNVLKAMVAQANTQGLAPEESETFTKEIQVSHSGVVIDRQEM